MKCPNLLLRMGVSLALLTIMPSNDGLCVVLQFNLTEMVFIKTDAILYMYLCDNMSYLFQKRDAIKISQY